MSSKEYNMGRICRLGVASFVKLSLGRLCCIAIMGIFLLAGPLCFGETPASAPNKADAVEQEIEETKTADNDDIEEKVDSSVKVAQNTNNSGVVWGRSKKATQDTDANTAKISEEAGKQAPAPVAKVPVPQQSTQKTTVNRPVPTPIAASPMGTDKKAPAKKEGTKYLLQTDRQKGSTDLVEALLEVTGDVKQINENLKTVKEKMEVVAGFRYEERIDRFSLSTGPLVSIRQYNLAKAKMKIAEDLKTPALDESLQTVVCTLENDNVVLFSPAGPFRGDELLLVEDLPGNTLTLDRLLPNKEVALGEVWTISDSVLRSFLSIDAVTECNVEAVLTAVADNMAMIEVIGDVSGVYLGAATEMNIRAKFQFDLTAQRINWLGLLVEENRSVGFVGPGFDLVARLQVKISPIEAPQSLTDAIVKNIVREPNEKVLDLKYDKGKAPWRFSHDRQWYIYQDDAQTTILHKLQKGELVARCNIADMGKVDVKTMATLPKFRQELKDGLGENFGSIVASREHVSQFGYKVYTVLIDGVADDMSLRWIYHLLTDKEGRQSVIVFVIESSMIDQFGDADEILLNTFQMGKG